MFGQFGYKISIMTIICTAYSYVGFATAIYYIKYI